MQDLPVTTKKTPEAEKAEITLDPAVNGACVVRSYDAKFGQQNITELMAELHVQIQRLRGGDLSGVEAMLFAQATALQAIFVNMATRAQKQERLPLMQVQLGLALKAQAQCRATLEALVDMKNPGHATFVQQQNIAHQQQVVNQVPADAHTNGRLDNPANKLLTEADDATVEPGTTLAAGGIDPGLEAVGAVDRTRDGGREVARQ